MNYAIEWFIIISHIKNASNNIYVSLTAFFRIHNLTKQNNVFPKGCVLVLSHKTDIISRDLLCITSYETHEYVCTSKVLPVDKTDSQSGCVCVQFHCEQIVSAIERSIRIPSRLKLRDGEVVASLSGEIVLAIMYLNPLTEEKTKEQFRILFMSLAKNEDK